MTADIVVGGLGGDGPIVTAGLGLSGAADPNAMRAVLRGSSTLTATLTDANAVGGEVSLGEMTPTTVEVPWMLAAAVDEVLIEAVSALAASMSISVPPSEQLSMSYDGSLDFDYPAGYDDLLVALASSTIRPQQFGEVWMSGSSTAGASMGAGQPPTGAQPLTYDGSAGYDYPLGYDAEAYVPATASMTPA